MSHIGFGFNKEAKNKRSVSDDMFPYQKMITHVTSQDFLFRAVDRDLFMSHIGFGFNKEAKNKRSSSDKICSPIRERSPKLYTVFPSYVFPYTYCHISENDYTYRHICFLSYSIIQSRITKRLYNNHKDFHRISLKKRYNTARCVFFYRITITELSHKFPSIKKSR